MCNCQALRMIWDPPSLLSNLCLSLFRVLLRSVSTTPVFLCPLPILMPYLRSRLPLLLPTLLLLSALHTQNIEEEGVVNRCMNMVRLWVELAFSFSWCVWERVYVRMSSRLVCQVLVTFSVYVLQWGRIIQQGSDIISGSEPLWLFCCVNKGHCVTFGCFFCVFFLLFFLSCLLDGWI